MTDNNLHNCILEKIETENITPTPRWSFLLHDGVVWGLGISSLIVGGAATAGSIFMFANADWDVYHSLGETFPGFVVRSLPYMWLVIFLIFLVVAQYNFKHTKRGYRYSLPLLLGVHIIVSGMLGTTLYAAGMGHHIDRGFARIFPPHHTLMQKRTTKWVQPDKGLLAGVIISSAGDNTFVLQDFKDTEWTVVVHMEHPASLHITSPQQEVRIIGEKLGTDTFRACHILPWKIRGGMERLKHHLSRDGIPSELATRVRARLAHFEKQHERNILELRTNGCERMH